MTNVLKSSVWLVLLFYLFVPLSAQNDEARVRTPEVAWASLNETLISWDLAQEFNAVTLTVAGSHGVVFRREFPAGIAVVFDLIDNEGNGLPDGHYTWELVGSPALQDWVYDSLMVSRETGDKSIVEELRRSGDLPSERSVQAGNFTLAGGIAIRPEEVEPDRSWDSGEASPRAEGSFKAAGAAPASHLISDDLIVQGSACIGFDCTSGESFGDDTIRLKENNLRLRFMDTSSSDAFPTNDWQITANDVNNGGAERFSIDDISGGKTPFTIEASAPSNSLYVDDAGNIGLGTSTPSVDLHVVDGDSASLRLEQDGSSGFTPQTWDVVGNETNFYVGDVTHGSKLPFRIYPDSSTDTLVARDGNLGVGTDSPAAKFHVSGGSDPAKILLAGPSLGAALGNTGLTMDSDQASGDWTFEVSGNGNFQINSTAVSGGPELTVNESTGRVSVRHELTAGTKTFKIDHPLDPANRFLYHSVVESPDMMNLYNGNVELDEQGEAWVELPDWFSSLNTDFRYQLTPIGAAGPNLHIESKISGNRFKVAGGVAGSEVSWLVTGVRNDAYARVHRVQVEVDKEDYERGYYLHPEVFGLPESQHISHAAKGTKKAEE